MDSKPHLLVYETHLIDNLEYYSNNRIDDKTTEQAIYILR